MAMNVKKFEAPTLQKAIEKIRDELGDGAIILQADPAPSKRFGKSGVIVTAAIDKEKMPPRFRAKLDASSAERETSMANSWTKILTKPWIRKKATETKKDDQVAKVAAKAAEVAAKAKQASSSSYARLGQPVNKPVGDGVQPSAGQLYAMKTYVEPLKKEIEDLRNKLAMPKPEASNGRQPTAAFLESELQSLKTTLQGYIQERRFEKINLSPDLQKLISFWQEKGMSARQIHAFLHKLEVEGVNLEENATEPVILPRLRQSICDGNTIQNPKPKIVCLVGPTGVGKTTTVAKLAALEKLKLKRRVALVTLDDYKIGGADQLNHYARILEVPFIKARADVALEDQIRALDVDSVFVDTYGVSAKDDSKITRLKKDLRFIDPVLASRREIHLTLPVNIAAGDVEASIEAFSRLNPEYLLFTKWDETDNWGGMLASILKGSKPVSFIGNGQEVPDDLALFSSDSFIQTVLTADQ